MATTIPPYIRDIQYALREYLSTTGDGNVTYENFVQVWNELKLSYLHYSHPKSQPRAEFLQYLYQACMLFVEHPYAALASPTINGITEGVKKATEDCRREERVIWAGCVFLLYALYFTQPVVEGSKVVIRVTVEADRALSEASTYDDDVRKAYDGLIADGGVRVVAGLRHGPAYAPDTLGKEGKGKRRAQWGPPRFGYNLANEDKGRISGNLQKTKRTV